MLRVFPVAGGATFWDDFGQPRNGGRSHHGNDLFAPRGTPVLAVDDGSIVAYVDPLGGNAVVLHAVDGATYYYAHLDRWERTGGRIAAGEVLGYVGTTGNAQGTRAHLHFEVHPKGGSSVDPFPLLRAAAPQPAPSRAAGAAVGIGPALALGGVVTAVALVFAASR